MFRIIRASVVLPLPELADDGEDLGLVGGDREAYAVHCADAAGCEQSAAAIDTADIVQFEQRLSHCAA